MSARKPTHRLYARVPAPTKDDADATRLVELGPMWRHENSITGKLDVLPLAAFRGALELVLLRVEER